MKIPPFYPMLGPDGIVNVGETYGGYQTFYRDALFSTLMKLRPVVCLEIGTNIGYTTRVFQRYFEYLNIKDALLITADVKIYSAQMAGEHLSIKHPSTEQVQVYPHVNNIKDHHIIDDTDLIGGEVESTDSVERNIAVIREAMTRHGVLEFDFAFIDGDHQRESMLKDIEIAEALIKDPGYILLDDIQDYQHESAKTFHDEVKPKYNHYVFKEWDNLVMEKSAAGVALIWQR